MLDRAPIWSMLSSTVRGLGSRTLGASILLGVLALAGCGAGATDLEDYQRRVARVLAIDRPAGEVPVRRFPRPRDLRFAIDAQSISWGEFADLHRCDLGDLAGSRNSGLGRVQGDLERLQYALRWLNAADACAVGSAEAALVNKLVAAKRATLGQLVFNALFASAEMQSFLGPAAAIGTASPAPALSTLRSLLAGPPAALSSADLGQALRTLREGASAGASQSEWGRIRSTLSFVSEALVAAAPGLCRNGQQTPRAERLRRIFFGYYVERVQPSIARRLNADRQWIAALASLHRELPARSPAYDLWYRQTLAEDQGDSEWQRTLEVLRQHSQAWQVLAKQCNLRLLPEEPSGL